MRLILMVAAVSLTLSAAKAQKATADFDHIAIYVQNLDSSIQFYSGLFHFEKMDNPFGGGRVVWYKIGAGLQFHLVEGLKAPVSIPFMSHFCFSVASLEEFMTTLDRLKIKYYSGADMVRGINHRPDGVNQIFIKDPDNYWVEINNAKH